MTFQMEDRCNYHTQGRRCPEPATHGLTRRYFDQQWAEPLCDKHANPRYHPAERADRIAAYAPSTAEGSE